MKITYNHSVTKLGHIQVLRITIDKKGEKLNHRYILSHGNDIANKDKKSIAIARLLWTSEIIKLYKTLELIPPASVKFWKAEGRNFGSVEESKEAHSIRTKIEICVIEQYKKNKKLKLLTCEGAEDKKQCENQEMEIKKRDFDCNTCSWFENGRCVNLNRSAYYPCPEWLRYFDPENIPAIKHGRIWGENIIQT